MLRKLIVVICLISFGPAAVGAQGIAAITAPAALVSTTESATPPPGGMNLALPAEKAAAVLMAAADTTQGTALAAAPEQKKASQSSFNWGNFAEVHLGDYRWIWWVGAAAALVAIHAGAGD